MEYDEYAHSCEIVDRWMSQNTFDHVSALIQVMACCHHAITWADVDQDVCRHVASLGHNELNALTNTRVALLWGTENHTIS